MSRPGDRTLAVMPGDGIGGEVMSATLDVLDALRRQHELPLQWDHLAWPSTDWHRRHGAMMPDDALDRLMGYDALLLGALGDPGPSAEPQRYVLPDGISLSPLLTLRKGFDLWACERPARLLPGAPRYLADERAADVDMLVIRENSEGEYVNQGGRVHAGSEREVATQLEVFTRPAAQRLIRHAFERARQRAQAREHPRAFAQGDGTMAAAQVCLITKRNALPHWGELYTQVFAEIAAEYPDVATHHELVDAACMKFVQSPWVFDVVVASNLQGDILTDLAAVLSGGMGVAPSTNINPDNRDYPALFEPTHGSAPDIAGQNRADPRAMLLTAAEMLAWLGTTETVFARAAAALRGAVAADLSGQAHTERTTDEISAAIIEFLWA
jgi:tartrate dehydrogenase/decarboxylase/D-malate dehydrogenase